MLRTSLRSAVFYFLRLFGPLKGDLQFIYIAITLCYYLHGTSVEKITFLFMSRSESSHFMPTFL